MPLCGKKQISKSYDTPRNSHFLKGKLKGNILEARDLPKCDWFTPGDHYAILRFGNREIFRTRTLNSTSNPYWNEGFDMSILGGGVYFRVEVMDYDSTSKSDLVGQVDIPVEEFLDSGVLPQRWHNLFRPTFGKAHGKILLNLSFTTHKENTGYEVPQVYFPMHTNCRLTPFQDAVVDPGFAARIGLPHNDRSCWRCLFACLMNATTCIYIAGWSVWVHTKLNRFRTPDNQTMLPEMTVGELLKKKASEGVLVNVLVWDDSMSRTWTDKMSMGTHDEETLQYFEGSLVTCCKAPKGGSTGGSFSDRLFTHHQKIVVVDLPVMKDPQSRRLGAFVGGLDLSDGRFDTPEHPLFTTLEHEHFGDFHQCMLPVNPGTPRQPWHDIHTLVEGSVVLDIVTAFRERWVQLAPEKLGRIMAPEEMEGLVFDTDFDENHPNLLKQGWNLQIFQSRDSTSARMTKMSGEHLPLDLGISSRRGVYVDDSCHAGYIHLIRGAKSSIYIENQYFLGSSHFWEVPSDLVTNSVPAEIAYRICDRIRAGRNFHAYILIPMWPEGPANAGHVQQILHSQHATMRFMYKLLSDALAKVNSKDKPKDYLTFYCLGAREGISHPARRGAESSRRCPIYVHSKMAIFDDTYLLCGSTNINDRSLRGFRDTEILVGGYQPSAMAKGVVHDFRKALFLEHLGHSAMVKAGLSTFDDLSSPECVQAVLKIAEANWDVYADTTVRSMEGHLLPYPIVVHEDGTVTGRLGKFPDTNAPVLGAPSSLLPPSLCA